jgi:hypothetical protein
MNWITTPNDGVGKIFPRHLLPSKSCLCLLCETSPAKQFNYLNFQHNSIALSCGIPIALAIGETKPRFNSTVSRDAPMKRILRPTMMGTSFALSVLFLFSPPGTLAFDFEDAAAIGAAYTTHLFMHEMGHQVAAEEVGADSPQMSFFTQKGGNFYPGLSTYKNIPQESKLPYAAGGERMAGFTFEYALQSYRREPTTYNKALMFFSCADFLVYTLLANYVDPENDMYDPNLIREETGCSKEVLLGLVMTKSILNAYRVTNPNARVIPVIQLDKTSAALMFRIPF